MICLELGASVNKNVDMQQTAGRRSEAERPETRRDEFGHVRQSVISTRGELGQGAPRDSGTNSYTM